MGLISLICVLFFFQTFVFQMCWVIVAGAAKEEPPYVETQQASPNVKRSRLRRMNTDSIMRQPTKVLGQPSDSEEKDTPGEDYTTEKPAKDKAKKQATNVDKTFTTSKHGDKANSSAAPKNAPAPTKPGKPATPCPEKAYGQDENTQRIEDDLQEEDEEYHDEDDGEDNEDDEELDDQSEDEKESEDKEAKKDDEKEETDHEEEEDERKPAPKKKPAMSARAKSTAKAQAVPKPTAKAKGKANPKNNARRKQPPREEEPSEPEAVDDPNQKTDEDEQNKGTAALLARATTQEIREQQSKEEVRKKYKARKERFYRSLTSHVLRAPHNTEKHTSRVRNIRH